MLQHGFAGPLLDLFPHGLAFGFIRSGVGHSYFHDGTRLRIRRHLHVESRAKATVGHLHNPRLAVRCGRPRDAGLIALVVPGPPFDLLDFFQSRQGFLHTLQPLPRRPFPRGLLAAVPVSIGRSLPLGLEDRHLCLSLFEQTLQTLLPPKAALAGTGPHPQPILTDPLHAHQLAFHQHRQHLRHQSVQGLLMRHPKIAQGVIVHPDSTTQPAIGILRLAPPRQLPRAAHPLGRGIQPQRHEQANVGGRPPGLARTDLESFRKARQIQPLHHFPEDPHVVFGGDRLVQRYRQQPHLRPVRPTEPQRPEGDRCLRGSFNPADLGFHSG